MKKNLKLKLEQIFEAAGGAALDLQIYSGSNLLAEASLPLVGEVVSKNELALIEDRFNSFIAKQELDKSLWLNVQDFIKDDKNNKYLPKPLGLLLEMLSLRVVADLANLNLFEQIAEVFLKGERLFFVPTPMITMFNGGVYGDTNLDFEEYLLIPLTKGRSSFEQKINNANLVYRKLALVLKAAGYDADLGVLGAYAPDLVSTVEALDLIIASINLSGFSPASDFGIGIDIGSANLYNKENHNYVFRLSHNYFTNTSLSQLYSEWLIKYPIFYLEDALAPDDTVAWQELSVELGEELVLAGDKLFTNDSAVLRRGLAAGLANSVVVNLQEYKSIVDVAEFVALAKKRNYQVVFAAAEQETNDSFIADLAVALGADFVKFGALARGERLAKYNRLLSISRRLENFF